MITDTVADKTQETSELEYLLGDLSQSFSGRINDIEIFENANKHAGTKAVFRGRDGGRRVILSVIKNPRLGVAQRVVSLGYGLDNEIKMARQIGVDEAIENHLAINYETLKTDSGELVSLSPEIEGVCLEDYVKKSKFGLNDFRSFFSQAISTQRFMKSKGMYHRDLSPSNLLVRNNGKLEAWVTDLGSACEIETAKAETLQTTGARTVRDPRVSRQGGVYSDSQEVYALAQNMLISLTGEAAVKYDSSSIKEWNPQAHDAIIKQAIGKLPGWAKKRYGEIIYKAMASDEAYTIEKFQADFQKASKLGLLERLKKETSAKIAVAGLAGMFALSSLGILGVNELNNNHRLNLDTAVKEASKYVVETQFNGNLDSVNNLLELELSVVNKEGFRFLYGNNNKPRFLKLNQGQNLIVTPYPLEQPRPEDIGLALPSFKGKVYFEGFNPKSFFTDSVCSKPGAYTEGGPNLPWIDFQVPENMPDGSYTLVTEIYAHDKPDPKNVHTALGDIRYKEPGKAISRKRIPVIVGNPKNSIYLDHLELSFTNFATFEGLKQEPFKNDPNIMIPQRISSGLTYEVKIPELGFSKVCNFSGNNPSGNLGLPTPTDLETRTLQLTVKDPTNGNNVIFSTFFPIRGNEMGGRLYYFQAAPADSNFADKIVKYREDIYNGSHN